MANDPAKVSVPSPDIQFVYDWRKDAVVCRHCFSEHPAGAYDTGYFVVDGRVETVNGEPNVLARARETGEQIFWDREFADRVVAADGDHTLALIEHEKQSLGLTPEDYEFWSNGHVGRMPYTEQIAWFRERG